MMHVPILANDEEYLKLKADTPFWRPILADILSKHDLSTESASIETGFNSTYPVFLINDIVIKFFGYRPNWQHVFEAERLAHTILATDTKILAPKILASDYLTDKWGYIISTRIPGKSWLHSTLTEKEKFTVVSELGLQLKYIHALPISSELPNDKNWAQLDLTKAAQHSCLPAHLIDQIDDFMQKTNPFDPVFLNGDIVDMHVFVNNGHLSSIIDWGDAMVVDRHYEVGKLALSLFPGDKRLLKTLLDAANWPITKNFATQTLALALYRQAVGLTQHHSFDVFYQVPGVLDLNNISSLDELALELFQL